MRYTRISTYEMTNGTFDELTGIVEKGILPTFANMRRENPGDVWKCPDVKSPVSTNQSARSSLKLPVVGD